MSDPSQFIAFADGGAYCGTQTLSFRAVDLSVSPRTYITSSVLQQNGWYAVPDASAVSSAAFQATCEANTYNDEANFCTQNGQTVYWSSDTTRTYALMHKGNSGGATSASDLLAQAANNGVGLNLLFDGSYNCTAAGKAGGSVLQFMPDGTPDVSCLSRLPIYLSCKPKATCPTTVLVDGKCPFGYDGSCA